MLSKGRKEVKEITCQANCVDYRLWRHYKKTEPSQKTNIPGEVNIRRPNPRPSSHFIIPLSLFLSSISSYLQPGDMQMTECGHSRTSFHWYHNKWARLITCLRLMAWQLIKALQDFLMCLRPPSLWQHWDGQCLGCWAWTGAGTDCWLSMLHVSPQSGSYFMCNRWYSWFGKGGSSIRWQLFDWQLHYSHSVFMKWWFWCHIQRRHRVMTKWWKLSTTVKVPHEITQTVMSDAV